MGCAHLPTSPATPAALAESGAARCGMADRYQRAKRRATMNGVLFVAFLFTLLAIVGPTLGQS